jgi:hypothetical protein
MTAERVSPASSQNQKEPEPENVRHSRNNLLTAGKWLVGIFFTILPTIAVKSTSTASRSTWIIFVFGLLMTGLIANAAARKNSSLDPKGPYVMRYRPYLLAFVAATLVLAEIVGIAVTYVAPEPTIIRYLALQISALGEGLFSVVGKFATQIDPPLAPEILLKAQTITTAFMIAAFLSTVAYAAYLIAMPTGERRALWKATDQYQRVPRSVEAALLFAAIGILFALSAFYGWFDFDPPKREFGVRSKCFMYAYCYVNDDLTLFVSALARSFASFGFGAAAMLMMWKAIGSRPRDAEWRRDT